MENISFRVVLGEETSGKMCIENEVVQEAVMLFLVAMDGRTRFVNQSK
jgi:hypothetical protein